MLFLMLFWVALPTSCTHQLLEMLLGLLWSHQLKNIQQLVGKVALKSVPFLLVKSEKLDFIPFGHRKYVFPAPISSRPHWAQTSSRLCNHSLQIRRRYLLSLKHNCFSTHRLFFSQPFPQDKGDMCSKHSQSRHAGPGFLFLKMP